ncbi:hypothetical protein PoB_002652500 [Plakobranchus ocellatus]|uniref:Uncharacterized protein n=1 Tax=Plakobranchus ocellatus TaxID=259542 RepID=A0AAV3ZXT9_9GAST|nr:hypothetical protein PoB_002652500 [Plakobranchus ocellatus]
MLFTCSARAPWPGLNPKNKCESPHGCPGRTDRRQNKHKSRLTHGKVLSELHGAGPVGSLYVLCYAFWTARCNNLRRHNQRVLFDECDSAQLRLAVIV